MQKYVDEVPLILQQMAMAATNGGYSLSNDPNAPDAHYFNIPIYFTVVRRSNGTIPGASITSGYIDDIVIPALNSNYAGTGINFYRLGNIQYIDNDLMFNNPIGYLVYSYCNTALNVYINPNFGNNATNVTTDSASLVYPLLPRVYIDAGSTNSGSHLSHEIGHNFGLLHTFGNPQPYRHPVIDNPPQIDHPYDGQVYQRRELAIRAATTDPNKRFKEPNCYIAGDLCCDTPADCLGNSFFFPEFETTNIANCLQLSGSCIPGCNKGTYRDYNADAVAKLSNNIMGYPFVLPAIFTDEQKARITYYRRNFWDARITQDGINLFDKVECQGSATPLRDVTIRWRHPSSATAKFFNSYTDKMEFSRASCIIQI